MKQFGIDRYGADCRDIRPHLQAIDHLFDVVFNYDTARYMIYFNGGLFQTVLWNELDKNTIEAIKKTYWINVNGDPLKDVDVHNERIEQSREKSREDLSKELAKDMKWALQKEGY